MGLKNEKKDFDAVVVGAGPNGLSAAIRLQQAGLSVLLIEGKSTIGGGMRTAEVTLPGFHHDICSAIHPMAAMSPFFKKLPLEKYGLEYIEPPIAAAHPFDDGKVAVLARSIETTTASLFKDAEKWKQVIEPLLSNWPLIENDLLGPLKIPKHPVAFTKFGLQAIRSATQFAKKFSSKEAKGLWAGLAAHSILPLSFTATSAIALVLAIAAHSVGWPLPRKGSQSIADALANYFNSLGGIIQTGFYVKSLNDLPSSHAVLFDIGPRQLLTIAGHRFSSVYKWQLEKYKYGMGVFKVDWALDAPIPFTADECKTAGTVHIGNTFEEIHANEIATWDGKHVEKPFVLLAQPTVFDSTRAPQGKHTAWAYCHVPNGSTKDMTEHIEKQVERFAPGFRERIIGRHTMNTAQMEEYNPNYLGGDIIGGASTIAQLFTRPALRYSPYRTSAKGLYICSASTPPGGGVHGMAGYHAAQRVLADIFRRNNK